MSDSWTGSKEDASRAAIDEILGPLIADGVWPPPRKSEEGGAMSDKCPRCSGDKSVAEPPAND